ncbi:serine hydrolase domain-containing protein [Agromyces mariniharenae]|uniref:Serine hydrolase n=1 Tax=Agromyces mariniharenae TaxID=2604423 RepID=A0A5S4VFR3_9MICO|nr:serine hydrolase [Agromyces mariniharenae]TYL52885.1 serine hydrolase [Agromyces mariniharenae]
MRQPDPAKRRRTNTWAFVGLLAFAILAAGCTGTPTPPGGPASSASAPTLDPVLPVATSDADLAVDRQLAEALDVEFASDAYAGLTSVMVLADGRTVYERYFDSTATDHLHVWSVTKSIVSTLVGIAIGEGKIPGVGAILAELLPDHAEDMAPAVAGITLEQLLTMSAGLADDLPSADDAVGSILGQQTLDPTTGFSYANNSAHLVAAILVEATGVPLLEYARTALFDPLGIATRPAEQPTFADWADLNDLSDFGWYVDPQGINLGGLGLWLRAQDLAKIGLLYLDHGAWNGRQVVPADWVKAATTEHVPLEAGVEGFAPTGEVGYGYLWWTSLVDGAAAFSANGSFGQRVLVVPARDLVVVTQANLVSATRDWAPVDTAINDAIVSLIAPALS